MATCGLYYERKFKKIGFSLIIGVDEAGRGPLAGPVVAGAVALKTTHFETRVDDSKKLSARQREMAFNELINKSIFGIGIIDEKVIDSLNILVATRMAMEKAIESLLGKIKSSYKRRIHVLIDGNVSLNIDLPYTNIIMGDSKSKSIASASILAKVIRDRIMSFYDKKYPQYGFLRHKGYPTKMHRDALKRFGPCKIHRTSFSGV
ncbi:MAG: ribonuclease HII [Candidatus Omnitrophica bacterium]|nr:ribonuclease HII [Candidatus Omnitrophota bacterium]